MYNWVKSWKEDDMKTILERMTREIQGFFDRISNREFHRVMDFLDAALKDECRQLDLFYNGANDVP